MTSGMQPVMVPVSSMSMDIWEEMPRFLGSFLYDGQPRNPRWLGLSSPEVDACWETPILVVAFSGPGFHESEGFFKGPVTIDRPVRSVMSTQALSPNQIAMIKGGGWADYMPPPDELAETYRYFWDSLSRGRENTLPRHSLPTARRRAVCANQNVFYSLFATGLVKASLLEAASQGIGQLPRCGDCFAPLKNGSQTTVIIPESVAEERFNSFSHGKLPMRHRLERWLTERNRAPDCSPGGSP